MKSVSINSFVFLYCLFIYSCVNDVKNKEENRSPKDIEQNSSIENNNLNISFLLDLSDRINPDKYPNEAMEYYLRDVAYIKSVSEAFNIHLRNKKVRQMNDRIQLYFDPEPQNQNINTISKDLKYYINRGNVTIEMLDKLKDIYSKTPLKIYEYAIQDNKYIGSDTWRFFKTKVDDYCIVNDSRNILVILTDGYIYHKNSKIKEENMTSYITPQDIRKFKLNHKNWNKDFEEKGYGFIPATEDLSELEILVLGINPSKDNNYEEDVILRYWKDWFNNMNVKRYEIKSAALPSNMDRIIKDFILKK